MIAGASILAATGGQPHPGGFVSEHAAHLPMLLLPLVAGVAALVYDWRRRHPKDPPVAARGRSRWPGAALLTVAVASVVAAAVHLSVCPEHFDESPLYGWFFLVLALAQLGYAGWVVLRPNPTLLVAGAAGNAAVVVLWLFTRLVAVPLGPGAGETEAFGGLDVVASVAEALLVVGALFALRPPHPSR